MSKEKNASPAQARVLASMFSGRDFSWNLEGYNDPTRAVIVRNGWAQPISGSGFTYPNETAGQRMELSDAGFEALVSALLQERHRRIAARKGAKP